MKFNIACLFIFLGVCGGAQVTAELIDSANILHLRGEMVQVLDDKSNNLTYKDVLHSNTFETNRNSVPNLGVSASTHWLRFAIKNKTSHEQLLLKLAYPNIDEVDFYFFDSNSVSIKRMGKYKPYRERSYNDPNYICDLRLPPGHTGTCLVRIKGGGQIMAPISIGLPEKIIETIEKGNLFIGIYIGAILIMFFYNLFIYYTVKDRIYLYYVFYILIVGLVQMCLLGYTFQMLWPNSPWLATHSVYLLSALVGISSIEFVKVFLRTRELTPGLHKGFYALTAIYIVYIVLDLFNMSQNAYNVIQLCAMILSGYMLFVGIKIYRMGYRPAKYFLLAWSMFLIGVFVYALKDVGLLPYNNYTVYLMPVGSVLEVTLLSFALADRINALMQENETIILQQNVLLESKVKERTRELEETREQLIQTEKMASLGQLTAGISHEVNNPINFVVSNVDPLKRDIEDILFVLEKYNKVDAGKDIPAQLNEIEAFKKSIDLNYLVSEINQLLGGISEGAHRTAEIVKGLKNFSRLQTLELSKANLHEALDSTLAILNSNISSANISVTKNYASIPLVECYLGKVNQVFMNVLNNAVQAIAARKYKNGEGLINISTALKGSDVEIRIRDNGIGIPKSNHGKVFEPFFTTKEVGAGTGLGLSIVYGIINSHNGSIQVVSEENEGAEFIITLPVAHQRKV